MGTWLSLLFPAAEVVTQCWENFLRLSSKSKRTTLECLYLLFVYNENVNILIRLICFDNTYKSSLLIFLPNFSSRQIFSQMIKRAMATIKTKITSKTYSFQARNPDCFALLVTLTSWRSDRLMSFTLVREMSGSGSFLKFDFVLFCFCNEEKFWNPLSFSKVSFEQLLMISVQYGNSTKFSILREQPSPLLIKLYC